MEKVMLKAVRSRKWFGTAGPNQGNGSQTNAARDNCVRKPLLPLRSFAAVIDAKRSYKWYGSGFASTPVPQGKIALQKFVLN
jgi:hypothetical protein